MKKTPIYNEKKSEGRWKKTEHNRFIKALQKYGKNWAQISRHVPNRTLEQIRSHAQKILKNMPQEERRIVELNEKERNRTFCKEKKSKVKAEEHEKESFQIKALYEKGEEIKKYEAQKMNEEGDCQQGKERNSWQEKIFPKILTELSMPDQLEKQELKTRQIQYLFHYQYQGQNMSIFPMQLQYFFMKRDEQQQII